MRRSAYFLVPFFLLTMVANAQNWPQFRGPNTQGHSTETNLPLNWSSTENIAWTDLGLLFGFGAFLVR